jgi:hypothetical protein
MGKFQKNIISAQNIKVYVKFTNLKESKFGTKVYVH